MIKKNFFPPYLIIEIANSHDGKKKKLEKLLKNFSNINYSNKGIKFQVFSPEKISLSDYKWFKVYKELFFEEGYWNSVIKKTSFFGDVWLDLFDSYSVSILKKNLNYVYGIKLQASVLNNNEVYEGIKALNLKEKKILINISGYNINNITKLISKFSKLSKNLILQIGFQSYPTKIEDASLGKISVLKKEYPYLDLCMADHIDANNNFSKNIPAYAHVMGCNYIEKHFCIDRQSTKYDFISSFNLKEMIELTKSFKDLKKIKYKTFVSKNEKLYLKNTLQIPVTSKEIDSGNLLSKKDLIFRRTSKKGIGYDKIMEFQENKFILRNKIKKYKPLNSKNFKNARIAAIVAARMKSTRLKNKAILSLNKISSIERCLLQCLGIKSLKNKVILATSYLSEDSILQKYTLNKKIIFSQGDPDDVIKRYLDVCKKHKIDVVVRVTGDCPLIIPEINEYLLDSHFKCGADFTYAENASIGTAGEIINTSALKKIYKYFDNALYSEYMSWYFKNNPKIFNINKVILPKDLFRKNLRLTLDYKEDLIMLRKIFKLLNTKNQPYNIDQIFNITDKNKKICEINKNMKVKYIDDNNFIKFLKKKTTLVNY